MFDPNVEICSDAYLSRQQTSDALTERGFKIAKTTLDTFATRGGGPPFQKFGHRVLYRWGTSLAWAEGRLTNPVTSTSELKAASPPIAAGAAA